MPEKKINTKILKAKLKEEYKSLLYEGGIIAEIPAAVVEYAAYLAEKTTEATLSGRPDLAESFMKSAKVRAAALKIKLTEDKTRSIARFAGMAVRVIGSALI